MRDERQARQLEDALGARRYWQDTYPWVAAAWDLAKAEPDFVIRTPLTQRQRLLLVCDD